MANITGVPADELKHAARRMVSKLATGTSLGRDKVYARLVDQFGRDIEQVVKPRTVGYWLSEDRTPKVRQFTHENWVPWQTELKHEARPSFLFSMHACSTVLLQGRTEPCLRVHEAEWAGRLEYDLVSLNDPIAQWAIVREYAHREVMAYERNLTYNTGDLDTLLLYKPWDKEHAGRYRQVVEDGLLDHVLMLTLVLGPNEVDSFTWWLAIRVHKNLNLPYSFFEHSASDTYSPGISERTDPLLTMDWRDVMRKYALWLRQDRKGN